MATYNLFLKEILTNEWTVEGGTIAEWLARHTESPTNPATTLLVKAITKGPKLTGNLTIPGALATELTGGAKITVCRLFVSEKGTAGKKSVKYGFVSPAISQEPELNGAQEWRFDAALSKAEAEALTLVNLEALTVFIENLLAAGTKIYEMYVEVVTEASAGFSGSLVESVGFGLSSISGSKVAQGSMATTVGFSGLSATIRGAKTATGALIERVGIATSLVSSAGESFSGALSTAVGFALAPLKGSKAATGASKVQLGAATSNPKGSKAATGALKVQTGIATSTPRGSKRASGAISTVVGFITSVITSVLPSKPAITIYARVTQPSEIPAAVTDPTEIHSAVSTTQVE